MNSNRFVLALLVLTALSIAVIGCAGTGSPLGPDIAGSPTDPDITGNTATGSSNSHMLWGWADLTCNAETGEIELVPSRSPMLHINVVAPVLSTLGMGVVIDSGASDIANGLIVLDVSLTHPFAGLEKFCGFDVKGILITPGTFIVGPLTIAGPGETELLNGDGITRWWNPTEFTGDAFLLGYTPGKPGLQDPTELTATGNPYKLFADSLGAQSPLSDLILPTLDDPDGRAVFTAGSTNTRRYEIQFPVSGGPVIKFNYAIDASWYFPTPNPPSEVPDDFPISANQPEAFRIQIVYPANTLEYLDGGGVSGGLRVQANVSDWQGIYTGSLAQEIDSVTAWAPTLLTGPVTLDFVAESFNHATYEADVTSSLQQLSSGDPHLLLVSVQAPATDGTYTQSGTTVGPDEDLRAWNSEWVTIQTVTCEADSNNDFPEAEPLDLGSDVFGTLCNPGGSGTDDEDYYTFVVPPATYAYGSIELQTPTTPTAVGLYDDSYTLLGEAHVGMGVAVLDDPWELTGGTYYIKVSTTNDDHVVYYDLYNNFIPDPCPGDYTFSWETQIDVLLENNPTLGRRSTLAVDEDVWVTYPRGAASAQMMMCRHSGDGGLSWDNPVVVNTYESLTSRMWGSLALGNDGTIYCGWIEYTGSSPEPFVSASVDGGQTWSDQVSLYDFETGSLQPNNETRAILLDTDDNDRLHAVWMDRRVFLQHHVYYSWSDDHGATWQPAELIDDSPVELQTSANCYDFDVAPDGTVVCAWTDRRGITIPPLTSLDIYSDTRDDVTPFGVDVMVNPPDLTFEQTFPGIAIDNNGTIHASWVDRRNDGNVGGSNPPNTYELYYAQSINGGATWINETEIDTVDGYGTNNYMDPRIEVSPWGNPFVFFRHNYDELLLARSCDGGNTWESPDEVYVNAPDTYMLDNFSFDLTLTGKVYATHIDSRNFPGGGYTNWNVFIDVSD